jgi:hypothetical protein
MGPTLVLAVKVMALPIDTAPRGTGEPLSCVRRGRMVVRPTPMSPSLARGRRRRSAPGPRVAATAESAPQPKSISSSARRSSAGLLVLTILLCVRPLLEDDGRRRRRGPGRWELKTRARRVRPVAQPPHWAACQQRSIADRGKHRSVVGPSPCCRPGVGVSGPGSAAVQRPRSHPAPRCGSCPRSRIEDHARGHDLTAGSAVPR